MKLLFVFVACMSWETYTQELSSATCTYYERCDVLGAIGYEDVDECVDEYLGWEQAEGECEGYDKAAAKRCVRGWQELECGAEAEQFPGDCELVCPEVEDSAATEE